MRKYYSSLVDDLENLKRKKTKEELTEELNEKLKFAIESENYEEASRIRDYMKVNNIQKL
jgi:protein-arginine kinase activator protein McsA